DQFLDATDVLYGLRRKIGPAARASGRATPAFERLVERFDTALCALAGRQIGYQLAIERVSGENLDFLKAVEDVQLRECDAVNAVDGDRLANQHGVEPATAALAAGDSAELMAAGAEEFADFVVLLGRERAFADASGVGLRDAENVVDGAGANA